MTPCGLVASLTPVRAAAAATLPRQPQPDAPDQASIRRPPVAGGLTIWLERQDDEPVVHLEGDLDSASGARLESAIEQARSSGGRRITVDATELRFVDLRGYRALMACRAPHAGTDRPVLLPGAAVTRLQQLVALAGGRRDNDPSDNTIVDLTNRA